jgi:hypothetical protein
MAQNKKIKSSCSQCNYFSNHDILQSHDEKESDPTGWWDSTEYEIIKCCGCDFVSFRKTYTDVTCYFPDGMGGLEQSYIITNYPLPKINTKALKLFYNTPLKLKNIYREIVDSYNYKLNTLSMIGVRSLIEGIASDKNIDKITYINLLGKEVTTNNLEAKINGLIQQGFITEKIGEILHDIRFLGNSSAHELDSPDDNQLLIAIEFIELIIENVYESPSKTKLLKPKS